MAGIRWWAVARALPCRLWPVVERLRSAGNHQERPGFPTFSHACALCILEAFSQAHPHAPPDVITYTSLLTGCAGVLRDSPQRALTASAGVHARGEEPVRRTLSDSTGSDQHSNAALC